VGLRRIELPFAFSKVNNMSGDITYEVRNKYVIADRDPRSVHANNRR